MDLGILEIFSSLNDLVILVFFSGLFPLSLLVEQHTPKCWTCSEASPFGVGMVMSGTLFDLSSCSEGYLVPKAGDSTAGFSA